MTGYLQGGRLQDWVAWLASWLVQVDGLAVFVGWLQVAGTQQDMSTDRIDTSIASMI
jgi:hypothetical protein